MLLYMEGVWHCTYNRHVTRTVLHGPLWYCTFRYYIAGHYYTTQYGIARWLIQPLAMLLHGLTMYWYGTPRCKKVLCNDCPPLLSDMWPTCIVRDSCEELASIRHGGRPPTAVRDLFPSQPHVTSMGTYLNTINMCVLNNMVPLGSKC